MNATIQTAVRISRDKWQLPCGKTLIYNLKHLIFSGSYGSILSTKVTRGDRTPLSAVLKVIKHKTEGRTKQEGQTELVREYCVQTNIYAWTEAESLRRHIAGTPAPYFLAWLGKTRRKILVFGMEFVGRKSLHNILDEYIRRYSRRAFVKETEDMLHGAMQSVFGLLAFLQKRNPIVVHGDLHLGNIVYNSTNKRWYVVDWGNAITTKNNLYKFGAVEPSVLPFQDVRLFLAMSFKTMSVLSRDGIVLCRLFRLFHRLLQQNIYDHVASKVANHERAYYCGDCVPCGFDKTPAWWISVLKNSFSIKSTFHQFNQFLK